MAGEDLAEIHRPVLLKEVVAWLAIVPGGIYVDGTLGLGGHSREILNHSGPDGRVIAFEWDAAALAKARQRLAPFGDRLQAVHRNFLELEHGLAEVGVREVNGMLIDIGLSSLQLDTGGRGFSFRQDEPLDMRMDQRRPLTAAAIVASSTERELADIFYYYGEEKQARRMAAAVIAERQKRVIATSGDLAEVIAGAVPKKYHPARIHVATKVFQALRIAVNDELANLRGFLDKAVNHLVVGGRLCVISFHSLEDRIVKRCFAENELLKVLTRRPITPGAEELEANPRSRSARLRVAERLA